MTIDIFVRELTQAIGSILEGVAAIIIALSAVKTLLVYGKKNVAKENTDMLEIRLMLGKSLALSLEFLLAADILRTAVAPTWNDIGQLAAIAALRTMLNYFLERETRGTSHEG